MRARRCWEIPSDPAPLDRGVSRRHTASPGFVLVVCLAELVELLLEHRDHLGVARATRPPADQHVVPGARLLEVPPLRLGVELAREWIVELPYVLALAHLFVRGHLDPYLLPVRPHRRNPPLSPLLLLQSFP